MICLHRKSSFLAPIEKAQNWWVNNGIRTHTPCTAWNRFQLCVDFSKLSQSVSIVEMGGFDGESDETTMMWGNLLTAFSYFLITVQFLLFVCNPKVSVGTTLYNCTVMSFPTNNHHCSRFTCLLGCKNILYCGRCKR